MNIFSEIYGAYFRTAARVMENERTDEKNVSRIISEEAFRDSMLFLPRKLIPQSDGSDWGLLRKAENGELLRITKNPPVRIMTALQKSWLRAKLDDPKFRLFLSDEEIEKLSERLKNVKPLYRQEHFRFTDIFSDGDPYEEEGYRSRFGTVISAIKSHELLEIDYVSKSNIPRHGTYLPLKIEYSQKNDKFRIYTFQTEGMKIENRCILNMGRITGITCTGRHFRRKISMERFYAAGRCSEPVTVRVSTRRNALERFMMEFASYEKHTERESEDMFFVKLWYDRNDETELLIRLLSFGPAIEITGPPAFRSQAAQRICRQYELLYGEKKSCGEEEKMTSLSQT